jgi:hypothetical protein
MSPEQMTWCQIHHMTLCPPKRADGISVIDFQVIPVKAKMVSDPYPDMIDSGYGPGPGSLDRLRQVKRRRAHR